MLHGRGLPVHHPPVGTGGRQIPQQGNQGIRHQGIVAGIEAELERAILMTGRDLARVAHRHLEVHPHRLPLRLQCRGQQGQFRAIREGAQGQGEAFLSLVQHAIRPQQPACRRQGRLSCLDVIGERGQPGLMPLPQGGREELGRRHLGIPQQGRRHTTAIDGEAEGAAHRRILQKRIGPIELELYGARQGNGDDGDPGRLLQAADADRIQPPGDVGLTTLGHQGAALGAAHRQVAHLRDGRLGALPAVEALGLDSLGLLQPGDAIGARADDLGHLPLGIIGPLRQDLGAGVRQHGGQGREGAGEGDQQGPLMGLDGRDGGAGHDTGLAPCLLQGKGDLLGAHLAAIVKAGPGAQGESPLQTILGVRPLAREPGLQIALAVDLHQGLRHLHAGKKDPVAGRVDTVDLPGPHHGQRLAVSNIHSGHQHQGAPPRTGVYFCHPSHPNDNDYQPITGVIT